MHPRATEDSAPLTDGSAGPRWTSATLFAFRFVCVYCMLEWVPLIVMLNPPALTAGVLSGPTWWRTLNITIGQWSITHVLGLPQHSPPRFSANNLSLFLWCWSCLLDRVVQTCVVAMSASLVHDRFTGVGPSREHWYRPTGRTSKLDQGQSVALSTSLLFAWMCSPMDAEHRVPTSWASF